MLLLFCPGVIEGSVVRKLIQIDPNDSTKLLLLNDSAKLLECDSVDVGFGAKKVLKKLTTVQATKARDFKKNAKQFLIKLVSKLAERCPLKYKLTQFIAALSPIQISSVSDQVLMKRFDKFLELLTESKWLSSISADRAKHQYSEFISNKKVLQKMKEFDIGDSVDEFYMNTFKDLNLKMPELLQVVKITLILSHGQARVESGFSINEQILAENMKEESVVSQRIVYEGVMQEGGPLKVNINGRMLKFVRQASSESKLAGNENKKKQTEGKKRRQERKRISKEINEATATKEDAVESIKEKIKL